MRVDVILCVAKDRPCTSEVTKLRVSKSERMGMPYTY